MTKIQNIALIMSYLLNVKMSKSINRMDINNRSALFDHRFLLHTKKLEPNLTLCEACYAACYPCAALKFYA